MQLDHVIFKPYDIRGIYPTQLDAEGAAAVAGAFMLYLGNKYKKKPHELHVLVGHDMRISSPALHEAVLAALQRAGVTVDDAGLLAIDQMYFALGDRPYDGGLMITASHNPKEYNGLKMYGAHVEMVSAEDIQEIGKMAREGEAPPDAETPGKIARVNFDDAYVEKILSFIDIDAIKPMHVILDGGSGMAGRTFPLVLEKVPAIDHEDWYFDPNGTFPHHEPNPEKEQNIAHLKQMVLDRGADFGAAFDGDADRIVLIDEKGQPLQGDITTGIIAKHMLKEHPGAKIVYNILCSRSVDEIIRENGGEPIRWKAGHTNMKAKMREVDAVFGGEMSGHLFFQDFHYAESSPIVFLLIAQILSETGKTLSELASDVKRYAFWSRYVHLDEGDEPSAAVERVREQLAQEAERVDDIDGYTFFFGDQDGDEWSWCNVRPSNTEPRISITIEAPSEDAVARLKQRILSITGGTVAGE